MSTPEICLIWAQTTEGAIGQAGTIPWHSKKDFSHFRRTTLGCPVIMGRKTWESLPRRPLPGRVNIVVSTTMAELEGAIVVATLEEALKIGREEALDRLFVIGGATLYQQALPLADRVFQTIIDIDAPDADTFAPRLGPEWTLLKERFDDDEGLELEFCEYNRKRAA